MKVTRKTTIASAVFGMLAGMAVQASAETVTSVTADAVTEKTQRTVSIADLDLTSPEGQEALHYRLARAAEQVCGPSDLRQAGSIAQANRNRDCYRQSLSEAMAEVNQSAVASTN